MTIQTADPFAPDTDLRAERDKAAGMAVVTLLLTAGPRDISITVTRDYAADAEAHDTRVRARVADRALAAEMGDVLGLTGVDVDLGAVWVGHVCGAPTSIVTRPGEPTVWAVYSDPEKRAEWLSKVGAS